MTEVFCMNLQAIQSDRILDARGLNCPVPLLETKKLINEMDPGNILELWGTDESIKNELSNYCKKNNDEFLGYIDLEYGYTKFYIKVK